MDFTATYPLSCDKIKSPAINDFIGLNPAIVAIIALPLNPPSSDAVFSASNVLASAISSTLTEPNPMSKTVQHVYPSSRDQRHRSHLDPQVHPKAKYADIPPKRYPKVSNMIHYEQCFSFIFDALFDPIGYV